MILHRIITSVFTYIYLYTFIFRRLIDVSGEMQPDTNRQLGGYLTMSLINNCFRNSSPIRVRIGCEPGGGVCPKSMRESFSFFLLRGWSLPSPSRLQRLPQENPCHRSEGTLLSFRYLSEFLVDSGINPHREIYVKILGPLGPSSGLFHGGKYTTINMYTSNLKTNIMEHIKAQ